MREKAVHLKDRKHTCSMPNSTYVYMYVCMEQKQTAGVTSGSLLARSPRINFCHIIKALTAFGSPTIPPTKPTEPLTNPQWWILPSTLLSLNHLDSTDSNYTERANCDCKLSTHATSRWCKSFDYIFYYFFYQCLSSVYSNKKMIQKGVWEWEFQPRLTHSFQTVCIFSILLRSTSYDYFLY